MHPNNTHSQPQQPTPTGAGNPWIGIRFVCANAYIRVYRKPDNPVYLAHCPKCSRCVRFRVGEGGVSRRLFDVSC